MLTVDALAIGYVQGALRRAGSSASVCADDYDIGYWSRVAGLPRPLAPLQCVRGWLDADRELLAEETAC